MSPAMARAHRVVLFAIVAVTLLALAVFSANALLVIFGGILFALAVRGVGERLGRWTHLSYGLSTAIILLALVACGVLFVVLAGPQLVEQSAELAKRLPDAARDALHRVGLHPTGPAAAQMGADAKTVASGALLAAKTLVEAVSTVVVVFFLGVYGAVRPAEHGRALLSAVPPSRRAWAEKAVREVDDKLTRWMLGRLIAMVFVGTTCAIAFAALGVPLAMSLAVVAGLLTFVEYVGAIISAVPPILMGLTKSPGTAVAVAVLFTALHLIEGYVLSPLVARRAVRIPPGVTLGGQVVLASLVGPVGLTFATPLVIVVSSVVQSWRQRSARSRSTAVSA